MFWSSFEAISKYWLPVLAWLGWYLRHIRRYWSRLPSPAFGPPDFWAHLGTNYLPLLERLLWECNTISSVSVSLLGRAVSVSWGSHIFVQLRFTKMANASNILGVIKKQTKSQSLTFLPGWRPGVHRFHVLVVCPVEECHVQSWHHLPLSLSPSGPLRKEHITWSGGGGGTNFTLTLTFLRQYLRSGSGGSLNISSHLQLLPACCVRSA